jgi:hydroxymethylbilane synthase
MKKIVIATRPSKLALIQAEIIAKKLENYGFQFEILKIVTEGDEGKYDINRKSAFTQRLENAVIAGKADLAVHSMKDLPSERDKRLGVLYPVEDDPADCLVAKEELDLFELPKGSKIGTSSLRRKALISLYRPDLNVIDLRGNVDTRLKRLEEGKFDALTLSCAAMKRLGLETYKMKRLDPRYFLPAPGQGIIAVEYNKENDKIKELEEFLYNERTNLRANIEAEFNELMQGGCHFPAGIYTEINEENVSLKGYFSDGSKHIFATVITDKKNYKQGLMQLVAKLKGIQ